MPSGVARVSLRAGISRARPALFRYVCYGDCAGRILEAPRGDGGFGYDPLFFSDELGKTFGEATAEEKDAVSHRGRALRAFLQALKTSVPASSERLFCSSLYGVWRSPVARLLWEQEVPGSNPGAPM